jgi:hypothetical protein
MVRTISKARANFTMTMSGLAARILPQNGDCVLLASEMRPLAL